MCGGRRAVVRWYRYYAGRARGCAEDGAEICGVGVEFGKFFSALSVLLFHIEHDALVVYVRKA